jgi:hypothetical protein
MKTKGGKQVLRAVEGKNVFNNIAGTSVDICQFFCFYAPKLHQNLFLKP